VRLVEPITDRQIEVGRLLVGGLKYREIGSRLNIKPRTVKQHVDTLALKLGIPGGSARRVRLALALVRSGLVQPLVQPFNRTSTRIMWNTHKP
jgi:DNA-binding NarL/FixJ family response regulator